MSNTIICTKRSFIYYFLWSISHPCKSGPPTIGLSEDEDAKVEQYLPPKDLAIKHVITKTLNHYSIITNGNFGRYKKTF